MHLDFFYTYKMIHKGPSVVYLGDCTTSSKYPGKSQYFNIIQRKQLHIAAIDVNHLFNDF